MWFGAGTLNTRRSCVHQAPLDNFLCLQMLLEESAALRLVTVFDLGILEKWLKGQFTQIIKKYIYIYLKLTPAGLVM